MRNRGAAASAIRAALEETNKQCAPPLAASDLDRISTSAGRWDPGPAHDPNRYFTREDGFIPSRLGAEVKESARIRVGVDRRLWRYSGGVYQPDGEDLVRAFARARLGERCRRAHAEETIAWCGAEFPSIPDELPLYVLNVANGLLDWRTGELRPHDPEEPSIVQLPVAWDAAARCPGIDRFLAEVLPEDAVELAVEIVGYTLLQSQPMRRAVLLLGPGSNGKSVYLGLVRALLGRRNVTAIPLQALGESRFNVAELYGKLANVAGDLDSRALRRSDLFKTLTGGQDAIAAERKFHHPFTFTPFATLLFSANEAPMSSDQTDAYFDRWIILPFDVRFDEHGDGGRSVVELVTVDRRGEVRFVDPRTPAGVVEFGDPVGPAETIYTIHSEQATFADSFGARDVSFQLSLDPKFLAKVDLLAEIGLASADPVEVDGGTVAPRRVLLALLARLPRTEPSRQTVRK